MKDVLSVFTFAIGALFLVAFFSTLKPTTVTAAVGGIGKQDRCSLGFVDTRLPDERLGCTTMVRCSNGDGRSQRAFAARSLTSLRTRFNSTSTLSANSHDLTNRLLWSRYNQMYGCRTPPGVLDPYVFRSNS
jgi:hypothetical protein